MSVNLSKNQILNYFTKINAYSYKCKMCNITYETPNGGIGNLKTHYATHLKDPLDKVVPGKRKSQTVLPSASFNINSTEVDIPDEPQILDHVINFTKPIIFCLCITYLFKCIF